LAIKWPKFSGVLYCCSFPFYTAPRKTG